MTMSGYLMSNSVFFRAVDSKGSNFDFQRKLRENISIISAAITIQVADI